MTSSRRRPVVAPRRTGEPDHDHAHEHQASAGEHNHEASWHEARSSLYAETSPSKRATHSLAHRALFTRYNLP